MATGTSSPAAAVTHRPGQFPLHNDERRILATSRSPDSVWPARVQFAARAPYLSSAGPQCTLIWTAIACSTSAMRVALVDALLRASHSTMGTLGLTDRASWTSVMLCGDFQRKPIVHAMI